MERDTQRAAACKECAFWTPYNEQEGVCRRTSPWPTDEPEHISHWPMTHARERCGEGTVKGPDAPPLVRCGGCVFWATYEGGLNPTDRFDKRMSWWQEAGLCVRRAPGPGSVPGNRAFWRATHRSDCCAEGERAEEPPARS